VIETVPIDEPTASRKPGRLRFTFVARIITAMTLGVIVGATFGPRIAWLGQFGSVIIDVIKGLAGPLLFFAIIDTILRTHVKSRSALLMVAIALSNAAIALCLGLVLANTLRAGERVSLASLEAIAARRGGSEIALSRIDFVTELTGYLPRNIIRPFLDNSVITIVLLAVLIGAALRTVRREREAIGDNGFKSVEELVSTLFRAIEVILGWVIAFVPIAVFCVVARTIGVEGFRSLQMLGWYLLLILTGLAIQVFVVYQLEIVLLARMPLRRFWTGAREAVVYALGSSSSLASLPVTLRCLDRMRINPQAARLAACVGTNLNNDGILLYEMMAVLFVAQAHGYHLTLGQQFHAALACAFAGFGIAAVPDAGLISLAIVLGTVGLPDTLIAVLLTVDWLLSRCRAMTNVTSDILVAVLLDRFGVGRDDLPQTVPMSRELDDPSGI
jgi:Na+/H+-dicarboxylate symporter